MRPSFGPHRRVPSVYNTLLLTSRLSLDATASLPSFNVDLTSSAVSPSGVAANNVKILASIELGLGDGLGFSVAVTVV